MTSFVNMKQGEKGAEKRSYSSSGFVKIHDGTVVEELTHDDNIPVMVNLQELG